MANFSGTCLFVTADAGTLNFADDQMRDRLELNGWTVTLKSDEDSFLDTDSNWETFDLAVVSESVSSSTLGTSGRDAVVGVVFLEPGGVDDWDLATTSANSSTQSTINMIANHEIGAGLAADAGTNNNLIITTTSKQMSDIDDESSGAVTVAGRFDDVDLFIGYWELGAALTTGTAAERRVYDGMWKMATAEETSPGFFNNDLSWAIFDAECEWAAGNDVETDRQVAVPVTEITATGGWTGSVTNIDDPVTLTTTSPYDSTSVSGVLVVELGDLTDPANNSFHTLALAFRRATTSGNPSATLAMHQDYVSEGDQGTIIASMTMDIDAGTSAGGDILQPTSAEIDNITDYTKLFGRIDYTDAGNASLEVYNLKLLVDGAPAGAPSLVIPTRRHGTRLAI